MTETIFRARSNSSIQISARRDTFEHLIIMHKVCINAGFLLEVLTKHRKRCTYILRKYCSGYRGSVWHPHTCGMVTFPDFYRSLFTGNERFFFMLQIIAFLFFLIIRVIWRHHKNILTSTFIKKPLTHQRYKTESSHATQGSKHSETLTNQREKKKENPPDAFSHAMTKSDI